MVRDLFPMTTTTRPCSIEGWKGHGSAESGEQVGQNVRLRMDLPTFDEATVRLAPQHAVTLIIGARQVRIG
jgi:hypothetical protein